MIGNRCITTPTGIRIGIAYEPPKRYEPSAEADRLQAALLNTKPRKRGVFCFWRWK